MGRDPIHRSSAIAQDWRTPAKCNYATKKHCVPRIKGLSQFGEPIATIGRLRGMRSGAKRETSTTCWLRKTMAYDRVPRWLFGFVKRVSGLQAEGDCGGVIPRDSAPWDIGNPSKTSRDIKNRELEIEQIALCLMIGRGCGLLVPCSTETLLLFRGLVHCGRYSNNSAVLMGFQCVALISRHT